MLSDGAILKMFHNDTSEHYTVQLLEVKMLEGGSATRYRLIISDGQHFMQAMLATQLNDLVTGGQVRQYVVVRLDDYICNLVQGRKIIIVLSLQTVQDEDDMIGQPLRLDDNGHAVSGSTPWDPQLAFRRSLATLTPKGADLKVLYQDLLAIPHDVTFLLDDGSQQSASRTIVSARSAPFRRMLLGTMKEASEEVVRLSGISPLCLQGMIEWMYTGGLVELCKQLAKPAPAVPPPAPAPPPPAPAPPPPAPAPPAAAPSALPAGRKRTLATATDTDAATDTAANPNPILGDVLCELVAAAEMYELTALKELCSTALCTHLTASNVIEVLQCAELHAASDLKEGCLQFIATHRHAVHVVSGLTALTPELLVEILLRRPPDAQT